MDKYIKQLLLLHSKIILPQFGAIVIANEETGELMFNEYLSYDDGKLSALLVEESNMDLQEAQNKIAKFVRELKAEIDKGETYAIYQLGEFFKNKDGAIVFEGNTNPTKEKSAEKEVVSSTPVAPIETATPKKSESSELKEKHQQKDDKTTSKTEEKETPKESKPSD